jgi:hypothetical protein
VGTRQSKTIIFLLLASVAVSTASRVAAASFKSHPYQAPCHEHGPKAPGHQPPNNACCLTGHNVAIVPSYFSIQSPAFTISNVILRAAFVAVYSAERIPAAIESSGDPPGSPPLRI